MKTTNYSDLATIAVDKSLLKEYQTNYGRTVYLDNNSEFQIKFFNPYTYSIQADIKIDGKSLGERLIIRPGQLVWLERYFDRPNKFRFITYEVDGSDKTVQEAIANNGQIQISFYKEKQYTHIYSQPSITWHSLPLINGPLTTSFTAVYSTIETGRVEKGGYSNQEFEDVDMDFESFPFQIETIKLLPKSQKPVYKEDLEKIYCHECGRKVKPKFKFCPFCGEKL